MRGFGVRLRGDKKTFLLQYRVGSQQRRESLGDVHRISLDDARAIARKRFAQVELGTDPVSDKAKLKAMTAKAALLSAPFPIVTSKPSAGSFALPRSARQRAISPYSGGRCAIGRSAPSPALILLPSCR